MLYPYPQDMPDDLITRLIQLLRGQPIAADDAHRLWHAAGYGLGQWASKPMMRGVSEPATMTECADVLEAHQRSSRGVGMQAIALPWGTILSFAMQLLMEWLAKKNPA